MCKERIRWIDVAKFFGMFAIYLGHTAGAGRSYSFVFRFHVPLFFLISGCVESLNRGGVRPNISKRVKGILMPFFLFGIFSIIVYCLATDASAGMAKDQFILLAKGAVRNSFFSAGSWLLSCLFIIQIIFMVIRKLKDKRLIFAVCFALYLVSQTALGHQPIAEPQWIYNIDSALYYIIYYGIGYVSFAGINRLFDSSHTLLHTILVKAGGTVAGIYAAACFFGKEPLAFLYHIKCFGTYIGLLVPVISTLILIWFVFIMSYICQNIKIFQVLGSETLYFCGSEYIIKTAVPAAAGILGLGVTCPNPLSAYIYTFFLMLLTHAALIPIEKKMLQNLQAFFSKAGDFHPNRRSHIGEH